MKLFIFAIMMLSSTVYASSLCVGQNVVADINGAHYDARIVELYADGTVQIAISGYSNETVRDSQLAPVITTLGGFQVNQHVVADLNDTHYSATIVELYSDGTTKIAIPGYNNETVRLSQLSRALTCVGGCGH